MSTRTDFTTPVGRLVQGSVFTGKTTDQQGAPLVTKTGPNTGQPRTDFFFAIAIAKTDPALAAFLAQIKGQAHVDFPHLVDAAGNCSYADFSWKIKDGDCTLKDVKGRCNADRDGFPGHMIFSFSGGNAPGVYKRDGQGAPTPVTNPDEIKRGYYIQVQGNTKGNGQAEKPGMYLNHNMIMLAGYGEEIVSGPDASSAFGAAPALPAGASATPLAAMPTAAPAQAPMAAPQPPAYVAPPVGQVTPQVAAAPVPVAAAPVPVAAAPVPVAAAPVPVAAAPVPVAAAPVPVAAAPVPVAAVGIPPVGAAQAVVGVAPVPGVAPVQF